MPPSQQAGRVNLQELKAKLSKILGPDKESQYFSIFSRFLSHRLTKSELDRQVVLTIGKENIALHNQIVRAILYNAACSEPPLPPPANNTSRPVKGVRRKPLTPSANNDDGLVHIPPGARSNGDRLVVSPRKGRSTFRDRKAKERQSLLGLQASTSQGEVDDVVGSRQQQQQQGRVEVDLLRPVHRFQGVAEQPEADSLSSVTLSLKRPRLILPCQLDGSRVTGHRTSPLTEDGSAAVSDEQECTFWQGSPVRPPLGIPFCVGSIGAAQRAAAQSAAPLSSKAAPLTHSLLGESIDEQCLEASDLPDADGMLRRMHQIAVTEEGLQGVSSECGNLLNHAVDMYLRRLIEASLALVQSGRSRDGERQQLTSADLQLKDLTTRKASTHGLNGVWPAATTQVEAHHHHHHHQQQQQQQQHHQVQQQQAGDRTQYQQQQQITPVSAMDFKVAMDANPQLLGENRPVHLERIMLRVFEQQEQQVLQ